MQNACVSALLWSRIKKRLGSDHDSQPPLNIINMSTSACFFEKGFGQRLKELESSDRHELLRRLWPSTEAEPSQSDEIASSAFLQFIAAELERVRHHQQLFAVQDFDGILAVIDIIRTHAAKPCRELLSILSLQYINVALDSVRRSMELAIRLWLTLNVHTVDIRVGPETTEEDPIDWNLDLSLEELLKNQFPKRTINNDRENPLRFDTRLTAAYLVNICGMKLQWPDDIASHLNFDLNRLVLTIYRHKVCLKSHLLSSEKSPISKELLQEILRTMDLLFPFGDDATRKPPLQRGPTVPIHTRHL